MATQVNPLLESAVEAVELEAFSKDIPSLIPKGTTAYSLFKNRATTIPVSNVTQAGGVTRPSFRVPFRPQAGAAIQQGTGDASSLLRGTGSSWDSFALSPVFLFNVCEISYLAQSATSGKARGLFNVQAQELKNSLDQAMQGVEGLINGDGSGALDQIPATATVTLSGGSGNQVASIVGMNVAFAFTDQQIVSVFPSEGGTSRGTAIISTVDPVAQTLWFSTILPSGTTNGDYLMVNGTSGSLTSGNNILGIRYWQTNSNAGTIAGVARTKWPGRLSTPTINLNGGPITQGVAQRAIVLLGRALGPDAPGIKSAVWYGPPEQAFAISNLFYNPQISQNIEKGSAVPDMARKFFVETFGGREYHTSWTAIPNRVDLLLFDTWYLGEMIPMELYDFGGGMTVVPVPDVGTTNGTYLTSHMFAYNVAFQLANSAPKLGLYIQDAATPTV
jgi:hypothetical protein